MDCREALRRLKNTPSLAETDQELKSHCTSCTSCRPAWEAATLLEFGFEAAKQERARESVPSLWETRRAVEAQLAHEKGWGWQWVSDFWKFGTSGMRWGLSAGAFAVALAFLTLVPFHYQKTVGYEVALAGVDPELARHEDRLQSLLVAMGASHAQVDWVRCDSVCELRITDLQDLKQCMLLAGALEQLCQAKVVESGARTCEMSSGPLLQMAVERVKSARGGSVSEAEATALLEACFGGDYSLCSQVSCDSSMAAACVTVCSPNGTSCTLKDSLCAVICSSAGISCGNGSGATPSCLPGSCMSHQAGGADPEASAAELKAAVIPSGFDLAQTQPNPFNPSTEIAFALPASAEVRLEVFNSLGRRVRTLVTGVRGAGAHTVIWDGRTDNGDQVPSGAYHYRLTAGDLVLSKTMTLLK